VGARVEGPVLSKGSHAEGVGARVEG